MTIRKALAKGKKDLAGASDTPELDTSLLLAFVLKISREKLYMRMDDVLNPPTIEAFDQLAARRKDGEPVAWIVGKKEFWGLNFFVGEGVLCPRPDSETLVEAALKAMDRVGRTGHLHDCCCGPGTLGMALAVERPFWKVSGSDISERAEYYFHRNNRQLTGNRLRCFHSDLMDGIDKVFDVIVSNPPYLTPRETKERIAGGWKEPEPALNGGGEDGLDTIRRLIPRAYDRLRPDGFFLLEAAPLQLSKIGEILLASGFKEITIEKDLGLRDRVIIARKE